MTEPACNVRRDLNLFLSRASFWVPELVIESAWLQHAPFAFWLLEAVRPRLLIEIGTDIGFSYLTFCQSIKKLEEATRCYAVGTWADEARVGQQVRPTSHRLHAYHDERYADFSTLIHEKSRAAASHFADGSIDLLHVVGRQSYEEAKEEFKSWRPKLSDRAVVIFHGTNVRWNKVGIWRLWAEVSKGYPSFEFLHGGGLGVLGLGADLPGRVRDFLGCAALGIDEVRQVYFRLGSAIGDCVEGSPRTRATPASLMGSPNQTTIESPTYPAPSVRPSLHIHLAAMAPQFLDVRTTLPLRELGKVAGITTSLSRQVIELPRLPVDQPKVLVLQRAVVRDDERWRGILKQVLQLGWILIAEIDDHPELMAAVHKRPFKEEMWDSVRLAHAVQTSTPALADEVQSRNAEVAVFPNAAFDVIGAIRPPSPDGRIRVFFGALNREGFSRQVGTMLAPFAAANRQVQFTVIHDRAFFDALGDCSKAFHPATNYQHYLELMSECDIALMPLEGGPGERFKSDIKWVEASSLGLATIASPVVYADTVEDGTNGLLARDVADWRRCLTALIDDPGLRVAVAEAARDEVKRDRVFGRQSEARLDWYLSLWRRRIGLTTSMNLRLRQRRG